MSDILAWSYSRLRTFRQCPLKSYWQIYAPKGERLPYTQSEAAARGERIHKHCEQAAIRAITHGDAAIGDPSIADAMPVIHSFARNYDEIYPERKTALTADLKPTGYFAKNVMMRCGLDLTGISGNRAGLIDWKTGGKEGRLKADDQLELFAGVVFVLHPQVDIVETAYMFLDHRKSVPETFHRQDNDFIWQKFRDEAELIQIAYERNEWPAKKSVLCGWCDVPRTHCIHGKG